MSKKATLPVVPMGEIGALLLLDTAGCSCCRDNDGWEAAINYLGELYGWEKFDDGSGFDWYSRRDQLEARGEWPEGRSDE